MEAQAGGESRQVRAIARVGGGDCQSGRADEKSPRGADG